VLLTRSPLNRGRSLSRVRLACVRHAASVDSEPGSNSHVKRVAFSARAARRQPLPRRNNSITRSPVDLALALFRTVFLSSDSWLLPFRVFCQNRRLPPSAFAPCGAAARLRPDRLTLDGSAVASPSHEDSAMADGRDSPILRAVTPSGGRSRPLLCLHALSSFQRTGYAFARGYTVLHPRRSSISPPSGRYQPFFGEPSKVTTDLVPCQPLTSDCRRPETSWVVGDWKE
jgi:hypothetical protein